jgi:hypothetical protein
MARKASKEAFEEMTVDELREEAKKRGVSGASHMRKSELIEAIAGETESRSSGEHEEHRTKAGTKQREQRKHEKIINSVDEHEDYHGQTLVTTNPDVIRAWAEKRRAIPATIPGTEHEGHLGVLRFDFPGYGGENLEHVSWDEWLRTCKIRNLRFLYQESTSDGTMSNFFRLDNPDREDT